jgi:hypothetical protein
MTVLQTIGNYEIISEKEDECFPEWNNVAVAFMCVGSMVIAIVTVFYAIINIYLSAIDSLVIGLGGCASSLGFVCILSYICSRYVKCGVKISLKRIYAANTYASLINEAPLYAITYQFTNDSSKDAEKIKIIVNEFVDKANRLMETQKEGNKKREQCCNKYVSTMQKVKLD